VATASAQFHESPDDLRPETRDRHRGIVSMMEELEAVDWYDQRIDAANDEELREILRHNRDEEKEHAAMLLEWLRRRDPVWHEHLSRYLFSEEPIAALAAEAEEEGAEAPAPGRRVFAASLGVGGVADKDVL
jgi:ferritin-like protein